MALKKKNVFQGFMQDDYVPTGDQQIVKYLFGKGNNLHEVESPDGSNFLVTMPKKFRQTVWLKKGDCLVIDPITEGKKVLGEIITVVPAKNVVELVKSGDWRPKWDMTNNNDVEDSCGGGDTAAAAAATIESLEERKLSALIQFYSSGCNKASSTDNESCMPPSSDSEEEEEEDDSNDDDDDEEKDETPDQEEESSLSSNHHKGDVQVKIGNHSSSHIIREPSTILDETEVEEDGNNRSRVQFLTSGFVTVTGGQVTGVVNDIQNELQSLDFETEDSSLESQQQQQQPQVQTMGSATRQNDNQNSVHRKANTIRIQVNYPPESLPENTT